MCGRFFIDESTLKEIVKIINSIDQNIYNRDFQSDIYPTNLSPVISAIKKDTKIDSKIWGYPHFKNKGVIINARSETVLEKKIFANGIKNNRSIIPATHFYEWNENKEKNTLTRKDLKTMYMAGFFDTFQGEDRFVILTTEANDSMIKIHNRMPLILEESQIEDYLMKEDKLEYILNQVPTKLESYSKIEQQSMFL